MATVRTKQELEGYFKLGSKPTSGMYLDLIETIFSAGAGELSTNFELNPYENTVFVNQTNGSQDGSGERMKINKPFSSMDLALQSSLTGDTIFVFPGTYDVTNLYYPGKKVFAMPGVVFRNFDINQPLLKGTNAEATFELRGYATLVTQSNKIANLDGVNDRAIIECAKIVSDVETATFSVSNGAKLQLESAEIVSSATLLNNTEALIENGVGSLVRLKNVEIVSTALASERKIGLNGAGDFQCLGTVVSNMDVSATSNISFGGFAYNQNYVKF